MTPEEFSKKSADHAKSVWNQDWEGGNHLMRYIQSELNNASSNWRTTPDHMINGVKVNMHDAKAIYRIAGAIHRFLEQVGAQHISDLEKSIDK